MLLLTHFPKSAGWTVEVRATDISTRALEAARRATWPIEKAEEIPADLLRRFMLRGTGDQRGRLRASDPLRAAVRFEKHNLNAELYPATPLFDLVVCRNVLIYFDAARRRHVHEKLLSALAPGGHLFVGHAESVSAGDGRLATVRPTIYQHAKDRP
jgi:chemotaxis protein methyltransferase CheR